MSWTELWQRMNRQGIKKFLSLGLNNWMVPITKAEKTGDIGTKFDGCGKKSN